MSGQVSFPFLTYPPWLNLVLARDVILWEHQSGKWKVHGKYGNPLVNFQPKDF
jgi:hypothetical protein